MLPSFPRFAILATLAFVLVGCAGLASLPQPGSGGSGIRPAASEAEVDTDAARDILSAYRAAHGLTRVTIDPVLERIALNQALAMARADVLRHDVQGSLTNRLAGAGMPNNAAVENVSAGYDSLPAAFAGWRRSPPHNANLLDPEMRRMGVAGAYAPGTRYRIYWALVMTD